MNTTVRRTSGNCQGAAHRNIYLLKHKSKIPQIQHFLKIIKNIPLKP